MFWPRLSIVHTYNIYLHYIYLHSTYICCFLVFLVGPNGGCGHAARSKVRTLRKRRNKKKRVEKKIKIDMRTLSEKNDYL